MSFRSRSRRPKNTLGRTGWVAAALVAGIGVVLTLVASAAMRTGATNTGVLVLAADGQLLASAVESDVQLVAEQVQAVRGLFEASEIVTPEEFKLFSQIVGFTPVSVLVYAQRMEGADGTVSWSVQHVVSNGSLGPKIGSDLAADPVQAEAIARAVMSGQSTASGLISLEGDSDPGGVAILQTVNDTGRVVGVIGGMIQIDERLARAAEDILGPGQTWELTEATGESGDIGTPSEWSRTLQLGREGGLRLSVATDHLLSDGMQPPQAILIINLLITGLAARLVLDARRRSRTKKEIEWLRRSSGDKDRFLAGVGHELRTPLTAVIGMLDLASDPDRDLTTLERVELLATARVEAKEIARIVDDFVTAGRLSADALTVRSEPTNLDPLVAKLLARAPERQHLEIKVESELGNCLGDKIHVTQIIANLLDNARRNAHSLVEIVGHSDGHFVTVEVHNDGPAIPTERGATLFEPFTAKQPKGQPQPVGLGLSVSRALARRMGGDLVYQWRDGMVVFALSLPVLPAPLELVTSAA